MDKVLYWLWIQRCFGPASDISEVISHFGSAEAVYKAQEDELESCPALSKRKKVFDKLLDKELSGCEEILDTCKKYGIHILTPESELYPESLVKIKNYPAVLYVRGDVSVLKKEPAFAVLSI